MSQERGLSPTDVGRSAEGAHRAAWTFLPSPLCAGPRPWDGTLPGAPHPPPNTATERKSPGTGHTRAHAGQVTSESSRQRQTDPLRSKKMFSFKRNPRLEKKNPRAKTRLVRPAFTEAMTAFQVAGGSLLGDPQVPFKNAATEGLLRPPRPGRPNSPGLKGPP